MGIIWLAGLVACLAAAQQWGLDQWRSMLLLASSLAAGLGCALALSRGIRGMDLKFDGERWTLSGGSRSAQADQCFLTVSLDLQSLLLVRLAGASPEPIWLWLDREALPERWLELRRAVHARPAKGLRLQAGPFPVDTPLR